MHVNQFHEKQGKRIIKGAMRRSDSAELEKVSLSDFKKETIRQREVKYRRVSHIIPHSHQKLSFLKSGAINFSAVSLSINRG